MARAPAMACCGDAPALCRSPPLPLRRCREMKKYAKDKERERRRKDEDTVASIRQYYADQVEMLDAALSDQRAELAVADTEEVRGAVAQVSSSSDTGLHLCRCTVVCGWSACQASHGPHGMAGVGARYDCPIHRVAPRVLLPPLTALPHASCCPIVALFFPAAANGTRAAARAQGETGAGHQGAAGPHVQGRGGAPLPTAGRG